MVLLDQSLSGGDDLVNAALVSLQLLFEVLVLLNFTVQVGRIQIRVVRGKFELFVDPPCDTKISHINLVTEIRTSRFERRANPATLTFGLVTVALELLQLVRIFEQQTPLTRSLQQSGPPLQQLKK